MVTWTEILPTACLAAAIIHSLLAGVFSQRLRLTHALRFFALEIEGIFAVWAGVYLIALAGADFRRAVVLVSAIRFREVVVVALLMYVFSSDMVEKLALVCFKKIAERFRGPQNAIYLVVVLVVGPLLGSLISEPASMAIVAVVLRRRFFDTDLTYEFKYALLATLFVNISIGGTLTPFAAPPVVMVAERWGWVFGYMLKHFGWKSAEACVVSAIWLVAHFRKELLSLRIESTEQINSDFSYFSLPKLRATDLRSALGVGLFLAAVLVLSSNQGWWVGWVFRHASSFGLYVSTILVTGVVDNAAITALASRETFLTGEQKYLVVAASVVGGGLTLLANAPNLIGYSIVKTSFDTEGFSATRLLRAAIVPTLIAALAFSIF